MVESSGVRAARPISREPPRCAVRQAGRQVPCSDRTNPLTPSSHDLLTGDTVPKTTRSHGFRPIRQHDSLVERAFEAIEESIVRGSIAPGSRLFEATLARELEISRGPVREAIRRLGERGR